uniref:Swi5-dependent recombination DNA repair protein 1 homolog n=1 Tax=Syphacia muris TaxID=451379 RepID=A0A0N5AP29_9BILA
MDVHESSLPSNSRQSQPKDAFPSEDDNEMQRLKLKRRSIRGRRSVAELPSNNQPAFNEHVLLDDIPKSEERFLAKINEVNDVTTKILEYGKNLDLQYEKWEKLKEKREAAVLRAEELLCKPLIVSSKDTSAAYDKHIKTRFQGCSAAEIGQIYLKHINGQMKSDLNTNRSEETVALQNKIVDLKSSVKIELRFLELLDELDLEKYIPELDKFIEEEKLWFEGMNFDPELKKLNLGVV